jgi:hypothetical protein
MSSKSLRRFVLPGLLLACLAGCGSSPSCFEGAEYQKAQDRPRLQLPPEASGSERIAPLAIPPAAPDAAKLDPQPKCIDEPPSFFGRKTKPPAPAAGPAAGPAAAPAAAPAAGPTPAPAEPPGDTH